MPTPKMDGAGSAATEMGPQTSSLPESSPGNYHAQPRETIARSRSRAEMAAAPIDGKDMENLEDRLLPMLLEIDHDKHIVALKVVCGIIEGEVGSTEKDKVIERLLLGFHREMQARQFASSRGEYPLSRAPDPSQPPGLSYYPTGALLTSSPSTTTAYQVLDLVAPKYRYRYRLRRQVQNDLARFSAYFGGVTWLQIFDEKAPVPTFEREAFLSWLAAGGRAWIIAELDKHSAGRVVAFRGRK